MCHNGSPKDTKYISSHKKSIIKTNKRNERAFYFSVYQSAFSALTLLLLKAYIS